MGRYRKILHLDLDAFFCAVEELFNPALKGKAFAVGGSPDGRGVVASCSYPARKFGIHSAMPMSRAVRQCPGLIVVHSSFGNYSHKSAEVMAILNNLTPLVEQVSIDEAFCDMTDLSQPSVDIARMVQREINEKTQLPCSIGAASNKLIAKIANNIGKKSVKSGTYPNAIKWVPNGEEKVFLAPLPVEELWGVGKKTTAVLHGLGIRTIGQLANYPLSLLQARFGKMGVDLHERANGRHDSPVHDAPETAKSISQEITFETDVLDEKTLRRTIQHQADRVGFRLRKAGLAGNVVRIKLRWGDFTTLTRQIKTDEPLNQDARINEYAQKLFDNIWLKDPRPIRLIGVGVNVIEAEGEQLSLLSSAHQREDSLMRALDEIRVKYGKSSLKRAVDLDE